MKKLNKKSLIISESEMNAAKKTIKLHTSGLKMVKLRGEWYLIETENRIVELNSLNFQPMFKIGPYYVPIEPMVGLVADELLIEKPR